MSDIVGLETLEVMRQARRYNAWQYEVVAPYLGRRICEIGSGIGNMSELLLGATRELIVLTDRDPSYLETLRQRFGADHAVAIEPLGLPDPGAHARFRSYGLDTVIALNVVEHISEDVEAVRTVWDLLPPGGRFVMLVPALPALYGTLDTELGHCRRYTRGSIRELLKGAGFQVERVFYFNLVGAFGWWLNARVLRRPRIESSQVRLFDALVPVLRLEDRFRLPLGQSLISVAVRS